MATRMGGAPLGFDVYRVPSKFISWALTQANRSPKYHVLRMGAEVNTRRRAPQVVIESPPMLLEPPGLFHTHRWQFTAGRGVSSIIRTSRVASITLKAKGSSPGSTPIPGGRITIEGTVQAAVDPFLLIEQVTSWGSPVALDLRDLLVQELASLPNPDIEHESGTLQYPVRDFGYAASTNDSPVFLVTPQQADTLYRTINGLWSSSEPDGVDLAFEPVEMRLGDGEAMTFEFEIVAQEYSPAFVLVYVALSDKGDVQGWSEPMLFQGGQPFFLEG